MIFKVKLYEFQISEITEFQGRIEKNDQNEPQKSQKIASPQAESQGPEVNIDGVRAVLIFHGLVIDHFSPNGNRPKFS